MGRLKVPYTGGRNPNAKNLPKPKRKKRPKGSKGSGWAFAGVAASLALTWAFGALRIGRKRREDTNALQTMLLKPLMVTDHGACRMDCRHVPKKEVVETLQSGRINNKKSNPAEVPCPKYVVDAKVGKERKNIQAVFSACRDATKLVTVIDKDFNWECYCP